jgi:dolichol-phosphate mannosyltransferase
MKLSVVIPARNEEGHLPGTIERVTDALQRHGITHEVLVVDDHSTDQTADVVRGLEARRGHVRLVSNTREPGFGRAVHVGLQQAAGDAVAIVMADGSDDPEDLVTYCRKLSEGVDCVFGSRFIRGARVVGYPWHKLVLNRLANTAIRLLFGIPHNDITNAFKCYRREVIEGVEPLVSRHFNLTVELPLRAIVRGYSYATVPIRWTQRKHGISKLKIKEMGSRYLFSLLSVFLEKQLAGGDYRRRAPHSGTGGSEPRPAPAAPGSMGEPADPQVVG